MKKFLLLILSLLFLLVLILACGSVFAQNGKKETVYLKNGTVLKGRLMQLDEQNVLVQSGRRTWFFKKSEIDTVSVSQFELKEPFQYNASWFTECSMGVLLGSSVNEKSAPFSGDVSANFRILPGTYAGLGAGVDFLEESYLPVFLNLQYHFRNTHITPFIGFKGGYMFALDGNVRSNDVIYMWGYYDYIVAPYYSESLDNKGGMMLNPSFGFVSYLNPNLGLSLSFGYRYNQTTFKGENHYKLETNYNRLSIRLGIIFN